MSDMPERLLIVDNDRYGDMFAVRNWTDLKEVLMTMFSDMTEAECEALEDVPFTESGVFECYQVDGIEAGNVYESSQNNRRFIVEAFDGGFLAGATDWQGDGNE